MRRTLKRRIRKRKTFKKQRGGNLTPSVAIYFSGRITGYENIKDKLLELKNKYRATVFCSLNQAKKNQYIRTFQSLLEIDDDRINIEKTPIPDWLKSCEKHPNAYPENLYSALYHNKRNFDMIEEYQTKVKKQFDIIFFYRADIDSDKVINLLHPFEKNTVYIPGFEQGYNPPGYTPIPGINGMLAYGDLHSMKIYSNAIDSIKEICNKIHPLQHEAVLYTHLKLNKINVKDIDFKNNTHFKLHRSRHNELDCKYVSTKGILLSCDAYPARHSDRIRTLEGIDFSKISEGDIVYVHASAIRELHSRLSSIPVKFKLVSGDMDESIPSDIFKTKEEFESFINSEKILHWFAQNCDATHPKLTPIPIGLDYHTEINTLTPLEQESTLEQIKAAAKPTWERKPMAYSNFLQTSKANQAKFYHDREDAIKSIPPAAIYHETTRVDRSTTWKHQVEYAFVASPHGNGLDCHRTWEALALGCIPIVKTSSLDPLYANLPVLIVKSWSDVTPELLQSTLIEFKTKQFNYDKITLKYWIDLFRS